MACAVALTALPALFRHRAEGHYRQGPVVSAAPEADPLAAIVLGLAPLVGATAYDLRMRLAGPAPWVVAHTPDAPAAEALVGHLRALGAGAVWCDHTPGAVRDPGPGATVVFDGDTLRVVPQGWAVPFVSVALVVVVTLDVERQVEDIERVVVSNHPRRGRVEVDVSRHNYARQQQRGVYLCTRGGDTVLRLVQASLRAAEVHGVTSRARFDSFVAQLVGLCPDARVDRRFVDAPRKRTSFALSSAVGQAQDAVHSNLAATDLAVRLLARAASEAQPL